eukprot:COSAG05_NODE_3850_length_1808_cov_1.038619_2_plen_89_part_00
MQFRYLDGTCYSTLALAPLMLLLSPGKQSFRELDDPRRYAPVVSSIFISCSIAAAHELWQLAAYRHHSPPCTRSTVWLGLFVYELCVV